MKIIIYVVNTVVSFLIIMAAFLLMGINIVDNKVLDRDYIFSKMDETEFYLQVSREVQSGFEKYIYQSGLPEDTIKDLFTEEMIKKDVKSLIDCVYDGTEIKLSDETVRTVLESKVQNYLDSQNKKLNEQEKTGIKKFEDLIINEYKNNVNVSTKLYTKGHTILEKVIQIRNKIGSWPIIGIAILIIAIILININDLLSAINFLSISSLSIGILLKLGVNLLFANIDFDNLLFMAVSLSNLITSIVKENLYILSDYGNIYILCGVAGILVTAFLKNGDKVIKPKRRFINKKNTRNRS